MRISAFFWLAIVINHFAFGQKFYRTVQSGNWEDLTVWETADDVDFNLNVGAAVSKPDFEAASIFVEQNHLIVIQEDILVDELVVKEGGHVIVAQGVTIEFNNGVGVDLQIYGTFEERGSNLWALGARWLMGSNGTLIRTNNSSSNNWRDAYQGGIINIPSTSNWVIRKIGANNPTLTSVGGMYYGNLIIENMTATHWDAIQVGTFFTGGSDFPRIKGDLMIGGGGSGTVTFRNRLTNANPVLVNGNIIVGSGSTLLIDSLGVNSGVGFDLKGNLSVMGTFSFIGSPKNHQRLIKFSGSGNQEISGSGVINIPNMVVEKNSGNVVFKRNLAVQGVLRLELGAVFLNGFELTMNWSSPNALVVGSGFVIAESVDFSGRMTWKINNGSGLYVFPLAKLNGTAIPVYLDVKSGIIGDVSVSTYQSNPVNEPLPLNVSYLQKPKAIDDDNFFVDRFWLVQASGSGTADLTFSYAENEATTVNKNYKAVRYEETEEIWKLPTFTQNNNADINNVKVFDVSQFSKWTLVVEDSPLSTKLRLEKWNDALLLFGSEQNWVLKFKSSKDDFPTVLKKGFGFEHFVPMKSGYYQLCSDDGKHFSDVLFFINQENKKEWLQFCETSPKQCRYFDVSGKELFRLYPEKMNIVVVETDDSHFSFVVFKNDK
ncbi:MAG: hypothetical protein SNJ77_00405 [Cytophagales bacterium]